MSVAAGESTERLGVLRNLLKEGTLSTQDELCEKLKRKGLSVTQSTVSRDLRKVGAVKVLDAEGRTVYRLSDEEFEPVNVSSPLSTHIHSVDYNDSLVVVRTTAGSASLVARNLDRIRPSEIMGTIAGDDTIFIAPGKRKTPAITAKLVRENLGII